MNEAYYRGGRRDGRREVANLFVAFAFYCAYFVLIYRFVVMPR